MVLGKLRTDRVVVFCRGRWFGKAALALHSFQRLALHHASVGTRLCARPCTWDAEAHVLVNAMLRLQTSIRSLKAQVCRLSGLWIC